MSEKRSLKHRGEEAMERLSSPIEHIKDHYKVVIVGSGYGGGIAAARLAKAMLDRTEDRWRVSVCVLERGKELHPGEYPDTLGHAWREMQVSLPNGSHFGSSTGLYDLRLNKDISVFVGCGLGGTSLVNANVCLHADPDVFDKSWPQRLQSVGKKLPDSLEAGYRCAKEMLKPVRYPHNPPAKLRALATSAKYLAKELKRPEISVERAKIAVTFKKLENDVNDWGVPQQPCTMCGDCVSGCNEGAKNTVLMNYLPAARKYGAEIYTQVSVRWIEQQGNQWLVYYQVLDAGRERFAAEPMFLRADLVILAAGTLGSTEILLRSRENGLPLSNKLGHNFTGNGDALGFSYSEEEINGVGCGHRPPDVGNSVGPCITGMIDLRDPSQRGIGMVIQEGSIPGALSPLLPSAFALSEALRDTDEEEGAGGKKKRLFAPLIQKARVWDKWREGGYDEALQHLQTYLVMGHDDGQGCIALENDRVRIRWPGAGMRPLFDRVDECLRQAAQALKGGEYLKSPVWDALTKWGTLSKWIKLTNSELITVHPLGGCAMADDAEHGVVNHKGQVFSGTSGDVAYENLYVCDGSIIPRPLGVNPLLTIAALAERCCMLLIKGPEHEGQNNPMPSE